MFNKGIKANATTESFFESSDWFGVSFVFSGMFSPLLRRLIPIVSAEYHTSLIGGESLYHEFVEPKVRNRAIVSSQDGL